MRHAPYLQSRGSQFYFRMRIPPDLRAAIGVREFHLALKCPCRSRARRLAMSAGVEAHKLFERIRRMQTDPTAIQRAVRRYYDDVLQFDLAERTIAGNDSLEPEWMEEILEERTDMVRMLEQDLVRGRHHWVENTIQRLIDENGWSMTEGTLPHIELSFSVMRAFVEAQRRMLERDACKFDGEPEDSLLAEPVPAEPAAATAVAQAAEPVPQQPGDAPGGAAGHPADGEQHGAAAVATPARGGGAEDAASDAKEQATAASQPEAASRPGGQHSQDAAPVAGNRAVIDNERAAEERRALRPVCHLDTFWETRDDNRDQTKKDYAASLRLLDQVTGGKPIGQITRADITAFKKTLRVLPVRYRDKFGTDCIHEAIAQNEQRIKAEEEARKKGVQPIGPKPEKTLSEKTIHEKFLSNIRAFMRWADTEDLLTDDLTKVLASGFGKGKGPRVEHKRRSLTEAEMQKIADSPLYTGSRNDTHVMTPGTVNIRDHRFWIFPIELFTGARPNEIGQLRLDDIRDHKGYLCFDITTEIDPNDMTPEERKHLESQPRHLKTEQSRRLIPVHPELVRIGLLEYVADMRKAGHTRLFPHWQTDSHGTYSGTIGKFFNRTVLPRCGIKERGVDLYSTRHTFKDILRNNGVAGEDCRILLGHKPKDAHEKYGSQVPSDILFEQWKNLRIKGLDLSHISYR